MGYLILVVIALFMAIGIKHNLQRHRMLKRKPFIDSYSFPKTIEQKVLEKYPHLTEKQVNDVIKGLREYFHVCNTAGKKMVAMPSQAVDVAWHEFILFTRQYQQFCDKALGRFLHHTPAEAMNSPTSAQKGIKTAWKVSCVREKIDSKKPSHLPILFAMDAKLEIPDGFRYSLDCGVPGSNKYCASHIGCGGCGGGGCWGDADSGCGSDGGCGGE